MNTIKSIVTRGYEITLAQSEAGLYYVGTEVAGKKAVVSSGLVDLKNALIVFDKKLLEIEGH